jgi:hypothetical protein
MFSSRNPQPEIRYESDTSIFALLGAIGVGAALMYFLDPESGRRRRERMKDQVTHYKTVGMSKTEELVNKAANQTRGAIARVQNRIASTTEQAINDPVSTGSTTNVTNVN